jgi:hypothetical protein
MDWVEVVNLCAEAEESDVVHWIPHTLTCGSFTCIKAVEELNPRIFVLAIFAWASTKSQDVYKILELASHLIHVLKIETHDEFMKSLAAAPPCVRGQFNALRNGHF